VRQLKVLAVLLSMSVSLFRRHESVQRNLEA